MDTRKIFEAIALTKRLGATYNGGAVILAPHILYTRHDELYVDAVTLERDGAKPRETKLGTFKLIGLKDIEVLDVPFAPEPIFDAGDPKYAGVTLMAVEAPLARSA